MSLAEHVLGVIEGTCGDIVGGTSQSEGENGGQGFMASVPCCRDRRSGLLRAIL